MSPLVQKTLTLPCHPRFLHEARTMLGECLATAPFSKREKDLIVLAVDEAASSIVQYARFKGYEHEVTLSVDIDDVRFKALIVDSLNVFDLAAGRGEAELAARVAQERSHTIGLFLIRRIMDEISYVYRKGFQNELELIKFL